MQQHKQATTRRGKTRTVPLVYRVTAANLEPFTRNTYEGIINHFLAYHKITNIEPLRTYPLHQCKQKIIEYVIHLRDYLKLQRKSIIVHVSAVRYLFYSIRDDEFPIKLKKVNDELPPQKYAHRDRGYAVDEIQKMLEVGCKGRLRERVVILMLSSAGGMRIGGLHILKKRDLKPMVTSQKEPTYGIRVYSDSEQDYFTPCSPECAAAIDKYLDQRAEEGKVITFDSPLIRNLYNSLNVKVVKPLSYQGIKNVVRTVVKCSGVRNGFQFEGEVKSSRGFRKFYKVEADLSGMVPGIVELTQGHSIGTASHYFTPNESAILKEYEKVIERVSFDPNRRLQQENAQLRKNQNDYLSELGELKEDFDEMKQLLVHLNKDSQKQLVDEFFQKVGDKADIEWSCDD